jgi:hypothetical protein
MCLEAVACEREDDHPALVGEDGEGFALAAGHRRPRRRRLFPVDHAG